MAVLRVSGLPEAPLAAAASFYEHVVPQVAGAFGADDVLTLLFPPADHTHRGWRAAAVAALAREWAPRRINALAGNDAAAIAAGLAYVEAAPGVTGQFLPLDGQGAGDVVG